MHAIAAEGAQSGAVVVHTVVMLELHIPLLYKKVYIPSVTQIRCKERNMQVQITK